jgi:hypothetical protein
MRDPNETQQFVSDSRNSRREFKINLPGGISFSFRGFDVVLMIVAGTMPLMAYFMYDIKTNSHIEHKLLAASIEKQTEAIEAQTYILTLSPEKRDALNLSMPESVRRRTIEERRRLREAQRFPNGTTP